MESKCKAVGALMVLMLFGQSSAVMNKGLQASQKKPQIQADTFMPDGSVIETSEKELGGAQSGVTMDAQGAMYHKYTEDDENVQNMKEQMKLMQAQMAEMANEIKELKSGEKAPEATASLLQKRANHTGAPLPLQCTPDYVAKKQTVGQVEGEFVESCVEHGRSTHTCTEAAAPVFDGLSRDSIWDPTEETCEEIEELVNMDTEDRIENGLLEYGEDLDGSINRKPPKVMTTCDKFTDTCALEQWSYNTKDSTKSCDKGSRGIMSCAFSCCILKAKCDSYQCSAGENKGKKTFCTSDAGSCDDATCCEAQCNWSCYLDNYADLADIKNGADAESKAAEHYRTTGVNEGRHCECQQAPLFVDTGILKESSYGYKFTLCPAGYKRVENAGLCKAYSMGAQATYLGSKFVPKMPYGCVVDAAGEVTYASYHASQGSSLYSKLICHKVKDPKDAVTPVITMPEDGVCRDTPHWKVKWTITCAKYESLGWCKNGRVIRNGGKYESYPSRNCCACGREGWLKGGKR